MRRLKRAFLYSDFGGPRWSPEGSEIAFVDSDSATADRLTTIDTHTGAVRVIFTARSLQGPSWSPDGGELAIMACTTHGNGLFVIRADGSGLRNLTPQAAVRHPREPCQGGVGQTAWSPDGAKIAFLGGATYGAPLKLIAPDGSDMTTILRNVDGCCKISWQPLR
jgi:Tol biopolymer transport system component